MDFRKMFQAAAEETVAPWPCVSASWRSSTSPSRSASATRLMTPIAKANPGRAQRGHRREVSQEQQRVRRMARQTEKAIKRTRDGL